MDLKEWEKLSPEEQQRRLDEKSETEKGDTHKMVILGECKCLKQRAKQGIEWALDYHLGTLRRDYRGLQDLLIEAQAEYKEITGKEPGEYSATDKLQRMQKEIDFYLDLRKEIIELPRCDEPAFEVQE